MQRSGRSRSLPVQLTFKGRCRSIAVGLPFPSVLLKRPFRSRSGTVQPRWESHSQHEHGFYRIHQEKVPSLPWPRFPRSHNRQTTGRWRDHSKQKRSRKVCITRHGVHTKATGSIGRRAGSGRRSKQTADVKAIVEEAMRADDDYCRPTPCHVFNTRTDIKMEQR